MFDFLKTIYSFIIESLTGKKNDKFFYDKILDLAFDRVYEVLNTIAYGLTGIILMLTGFIFTYYNLLSQYDRIGTVDLGAVAIGGIVLIFIGFGIVYNNSRKFITDTVKTTESSLMQTPSPIENAIAAFIQDIVKEREYSREKEKEQAKTHEEKIFDNEFHLQ